MNFTEEKNFLFQEFMRQENEKLRGKDTLKIDLHCHDYNSDVPDEILGRILNIPETWLPTEDLVSSLNQQNCDVITITNHNNARSCFALQKQGRDVLTGAEFTCHIAEFHTSIHVLTFGFNEDQEIILNKKRGNLYQFLEYTNAQNIPTIWAHPLYYYSKKGTPPIEFFQKMSLVFERFEVINGQRDSWQNMLSLHWIKNLNEEKIREFSKKFHINLEQYCRNPFKKSIAGGSDSHMGIFAGLTGTNLIIENLGEKLKTQSKSQIALNALRNGDMSPFGAPNENEKMTAAFLDYFCQIGMHMQDPGLIRIILHKGSANEKLLGFLITNSFMELRKHKKTISFLKIFHECFQGIVPNAAKKIFVIKDYKNIFDLARNIALTRKNNPTNLPEVFQDSIEKIFQDLNDVFFRRLVKKQFHEKFFTYDWPEENISKIIESLELPSTLRSYTNPKKKNHKKGNIDLTKILDGLSFPMLASTVLYSAAFTSTKVLYNNRSLLKTFAEHEGILKHPQRMLWLTDTFGDKNGVSVSLRHMLEQIKKKNLPIDLLISSDRIEPEDHLIVVKPFYKFTLPFYHNQEIRIPNILTIHELFRKGEFDRIMCSTEGIMGLITLILKSSYSVPAYFFVHTDWITFIKKTLDPDIHMLNRIRRILRVFYRQFDKIFVLNKEQKLWFKSKEIGIDADKVFQTAHWSDSMFKPVQNHPTEIFGTNPGDKIILYAGRISHEKGIEDLESVYKRVKSSIPEVRLVIAGSGPAEGYIREKIPEAILLGWVDYAKLPEVYSAADLLILPSRFDTFGRVIIEAMACGLPVISYSSKGPKDIIQNEKTGLLVNSKTEMASKIIDFFQPKTPSSSWEENKDQFRKNCLIRSKDYSADEILKTFVENLNLQN